MEWLKTRGCAETVSSRAVERVPRSYLDTWIHLRERIIRGLEAVLTLVAWRAALRSIFRSRDPERKHHPRLWSRPIEAIFPRAPSSSYCPQAVPGRLQICSSACPRSRPFCLSVAGIELHMPRKVARFESSLSMNSHLLSTCRLGHILWLGCFETKTRCRG